MPDPEVVLEASHLTKTFHVGRSGFGRSRVSAVDDVSITLHRGESLGIVGESGCGKTTLARMLVGLEQPDTGTITVAGQDVGATRRGARRALSRNIQMVFQDPYTSLNPRLTVYDLVSEPLIVHRSEPDGAARRKRVAELLDLVNLSPDMMSRFPHQFSGGPAAAHRHRPRHRARPARARLRRAGVGPRRLGAGPGGQPAAPLQRRLGLGLIFIAHDLGVVRHVSDRIAVMYLGRLAETAPTSALFTDPAHPYTQALLSASPQVDRHRRKRMGGRIILAGDPPSPTDPPSGCRFHTRCPLATEICSAEQPPLVEVGPAHAVACHHHDEARALAASRSDAVVGPA